MDTPKTQNKLNDYANNVLFHNMEKKRFVDVIKEEIEKKAIIKTCLEKGMSCDAIEQQYPNIKFSKE